MLKFGRTGSLSLEVYLGGGFLGRLLADKARLILIAESGGLFTGADSSQTAEIRRDVITMVTMKKQIKYPVGTLL